MNTDEHRYDLVFCLFRRICGYDSVELSSLLVLISLPGESTSVFYGVGKEISMSIIQSQCSVACSTMPLRIKLFTTAPSFALQATADRSLERGVWERRLGFLEG